MTADRQQHQPRPPTGTPSWVKAIGIVALLMLILLVILHLTGNGMGDHGSVLNEASLAFSPGR